MAHKFLFVSERLGYRPLQESDFDNYVKLDSDPEIRNFFPDGSVLNDQQVRENIQRNIAFYKQHGFGTLLAFELASDHFVGRCGFGQLATGEIEVGYVFLKEFWGKGLASEALTALLLWAKNNIKSVDTVLAYTPISHLASQRVMQKAAMDFYKKEKINGVEHIFYKVNLR